MWCHFNVSVEYKRTTAPFLFLHENFNVSTAEPKKSYFYLSQLVLLTAFNLHTSKLQLGLPLDTTATCIYKQSALNYNLQAEILKKILMLFAEQLFNLQQVGSLILTF